MNGNFLGVCHVIPSKQRAKRRNGSQVWRRTEFYIAAPAQRRFAAPTLGRAAGTGATATSAGRASAV
jgi:hypothetical protein